MATEAPPPAPHQQKAFDAAKLESLIVTILGMVVTGGGALLDALTANQMVPPHAHYVIVAGMVITLAGRAQKALATHSFLQATDNG